MEMLLIVWGLLTAVLILILIYRNTLTIHEDDQIFLGEDAAKMEAEQTKHLERVNRLTMAVRVLGTASGLLLVIAAGWWVYVGLTRSQ